MTSGLWRLQRHDASELLDDPVRYRAELPANLRDIRRLNRWLGGTYLALSAVDAVSRTSPLSLLDVATGSADIPVALWRRAERRQRVLEVVATDVSPEVLEDAAQIVRGTPVALQQADVRNLPWEDGSMDIVLCCLALHHFGPEHAVTALSEMWRVARRAVIVVDLTRSPSAYIGTWLATHLIAFNRLTHHDGPLSVLRAYTPRELTCLAVQAGLATAVVRRRFPFRQVLIAEKPQHDRHA